MKQTYGIANDCGVETVDAGGSNETNALLGERDSAVAHEGSSERDGQATLGSCISNLCNTIIGTGELSLLPSFELVVDLLLLGMLTFPLVRRL